MNQALKFLCQETDTKPNQWEELDGPESGVGVEYWYRHKKSGQEAYLCIDQGEVVSFTLN